MSLGMEVGLGPDDFVLDGDPAPPKKGTAPITSYSYNYTLQVWPPIDGAKFSPPPQKRGTPPNFRPMSIVAKRSPISGTAELLLQLVNVCKYGQVQEIQLSHTNDLAVIDI